MKGAHIHEPAGEPAGVVALTHGAGGSMDSPLLIALCEEWARRGWLALRYNLPYRRRRPTGPPSGSAESDMSGIREALQTARTLSPGPLLAGGHSYGGRLTSMVVADGAEGVEHIDGLTVFSYPLHPPGKPERPRTGHLSEITVPAVFTHGTRDPFGSIADLRSAVALMPARTAIVEATGMPHDLGFSKAGTKAPDLPARAVDAALRCSVGG